MDSEEAFSANAIQNGVDASAGESDANDAGRQVSFASASQNVIHECASESESQYAMNSEKVTAENVLDDNAGEFATKCGMDRKVFDDRQANWKRPRARMHRIRALTKT